MPNSNQFSIHDAAAASGLTPSVIRVWEERYGWPPPKRHRNGYRAFALHEIDELKKVAALVKNGDGFRIPQKLTIAKGDYTPSAQIDLSYVVPLPHDAGTIPPNSCADLGGADGGAPDGGP